MTFVKSGIYVNTLMGILTGVAFTPSAFNAITTPANWKIALLTTSASDGVAPVNFSATSVNWASTNECSGTGWATGGVLLSTCAAGGTSAVPTLAEGTAGSLRYDHTNDTAVSGTTLTNAGGCIIYADYLTGPTGPPDYHDAMFVMVNFGGGFSTTAGIFGIQWSATGIFEIDLTP